MSMELFYDLCKEFYNPRKIRYLIMKDPVLEMLKKRSNIFF